jgi:hypothetical protein
MSDKYALAEIEKIISSKLLLHEAWVRKLVEGAFPGGDIESHRKYHQDIIAATEEQKKFWQDARRILLSKGIDGLFTVLKVLLLLALAGLAARWHILPLLSK